MRKLAVDLSFSSDGLEAKSYNKSFDVEDDLTTQGWNYLAALMFRECQMETLYRTYRPQLPPFQGFFEASQWSPSSFADLTRAAAHSTTAEAWLQTRTTFFDTAHL